MTKEKYQSQPRNHQSVYVAHIRKHDGACQSLETHLVDVGELAKLFAGKIDLADAGLLLGLLHDFGKYSRQFQNYINSAEGRIQPDEDEYVEAGKLRGKIDHSTAGAQYLWHRLKSIGAVGQGELCSQLLALCIASHHSGLIDCLSEDGEYIFRKRMNKADEHTHLEEALTNSATNLRSRIDALLLAPMVKLLFGKMQKIATFPRNSAEELGKVDAFYLGTLTRFLFSCLVDADRINSAEFENPARARARLKQRDWHNWSVAINRLETTLDQFPIRHPIDEVRRSISDVCRARSGDEQGIYTLTVPTGGGKTLASLRYALHHAAHHQLDRIIYIIPYTSIIEQNADQVRRILQREDDPFSWVLEHHSNLEPEQRNWHSKLVSDNWDAPIVFTTMVQFLECLYAGGTKSVRRMHQLANAVLIFDEIQTIPINCVHMFCSSLNFLGQYARTSALLCTATQPILEALRSPENGQLQLAENAELVESTQRLFDDLKRVDVNNKIKPGGWSLGEVGRLARSHLGQYGSCLVIVNTKIWANDLFRDSADYVDGETLFHLSTNQCPAHRKALLNEIRERLASGLSVLCFSTQLIEAGVDVSFASAIRFVAGLDSIAQAAGRCNRNGELTTQGGAPLKGQVDVINPDQESIDLLPEIKVGREKAQRVLSEIAPGEELSPDSQRKYFQYYFYDRSDCMSYPITSKKNLRSDTMLNLLSTNSRNVGNGANSATSNIRRAQSGKLPLLQQSFMQAGKAFQAIDSPTRTLVVPFEQGREIIVDLCYLAREFDAARYYSALRRAQPYSVNLFPNIWDKLVAVEAIHETQEGEGIYYLDSRYYSEHFGVSTEPVEKLDLLIS